MGSCQDGGLESVNATAGSLVWVRRRNGSWWPGLVLALDELSDPPRPGTPIKLLGREDGSVDWYNLEKSKRIKAFRCGEYDECIEKAKSSASHRRRKSSNEGKYVRRDHAILHALELEKAHFLQGAQRGERMDISVCKTLNRRPKHVNGLNNRPIHASGALSVLEENPARGFSQSMVLYEQTDSPTVTGLPTSSAKRQRTPNDSEEDTNDGIQRMRDLREISMEMSSKQKTSASTFTNGSEELAFFDSSALHSSSIHHGFGSGNPMNGSNQSSSSLKRKRSNMVLAYENLRRKYRSRPLSKLCEGTRVIIPTHCDWGPFSGQSSHEGPEENKVSGLKSFVRTAGFTAAMDGSPDSSGTSFGDPLLDMSPSTHSAAVEGYHLCPETMDTGPSSMSRSVENGFFNAPLVMGEMFEGDCQQTSRSNASKKVQSSEEEKIFGHCSDGGANSCSPPRINQNRMKRVKNTSVHGYNPRRIVQHQALRSKIEPLDDGIANDSSNGLMESENDIPLARTKSVLEVGDAAQAELRSAVSTFVSIAGQNSVTEREYDVCAEAVKKLTSSDNATLLPDGILQDSSPFCRVRHAACTKPQVLKPVNGISVDSALFNVELQVQGNYKGHRVPLVSLMSKLNGRAIVGHPVTVQALEDEFCDPLVTRNNSRLVASSIERPREKVNVVQFQLGARGGRSDHKSTKSLKNVTPHNRKTGFSPRKMRRLSSITVDHKCKEEDRRSAVGKVGWPAVACVPVRLVFSRIIEALSFPAPSENPTSLV